MKARSFKYSTLNIHPIHAQASRLTAQAPRLGNRYKPCSKSVHQKKISRVEATAEKAGKSTEEASVASPSICETARTVMDLVNHGTLSTVCGDGGPLGTYVTFVLDREVLQAPLNYKCGFKT